MKSVSAIIHVRFDFDEEDLEALKEARIADGSPFFSEEEALYALALGKLEVIGANMRDVEVDFASLK